MATFYIVAFLSSTISEELRKKKGELIQKQDDYNQLEFNRNIVRLGQRPPTIVGAD
jgi:hypothetical protein